MDFLKTLMLYMSLTFAASMQAAPVPEPTQEPTAAPYFAVETLPPPAEETSAAVTAELATAQVTLAPTQPPEPTITPNTAYTTLRQDQKGNKVKKLQQRLIELGYLPEGTADGVYGNQTRRAVLSFQKANGLNADGVAGIRTLTHLYENPEVKTGSYLSTPTPEVTAPPESTIAPPEAQPSAEPTEVPVQREALEGAAIVYNDGEAPLTCYHQQDGVTVSTAPRLYRLEDGRIQLSLGDLTSAIAAWSMTTDDHLIALTAEGHVVTLMRIGGQYSCVVNGRSVALTEGDVTVVSGEPYITTDFLTKALNAEAVWDEEEATLILRITPQGQSND